MLLTNNHFTPIIGVDLHFNTLPPWNPIHPYIGIVIDPFDYLPFVGGTTYVNGIMRGISDTSGRIGTFIHIPLFTGPFAMTPIIGHESVNFFGSQNAYIEGRRISPKGYMKMTCNDIGIPLSLKPGKKFIPIPSLFAPTSFSISIPSGPPVFVGAPYVPDWTGALINLVASFGMGALFKGLGRGMARLNKLLPGTNKFTQGLKRSMCRMGFEPVDLVTGRMVYDYIDFELPGPLPLVWERNYYSDSTYEGPLGIGHHHSYDMSLTVHEQEGLIAVVLPDGRQVAFEQLRHTNDSTFNRNERLVLTKTPDGFSLFSLDDRTAWQLEPINGVHHVFKPRRLENEMGHGITFHYEEGLLTEMTDSAGRLYVLHHDQQQRITSITFGKEGNTLVRYEYDTLGHMIAAYDALDQATLMEYDKHHRMVRKTDRNGAVFFWEYDEKGRCVFTSGEDGTLKGSIAYNEGYNDITNSLGAVERLYYDENLLVIQEEDALGNSQFFEYTAFSEPYREIDEEGNLRGYTYDDHGNLETVMHPDGTQERYLYDEEDRMIIAVDTNGGKSIRNYDEEGRLVSVTAPDNSSLYLEYNDQNLVDTLSGENGQTTTLHYDRHHNITKMELPEGGATEWMYDAYGKVTGIKNPLDNVQSFNYDLLGRVINIVQGDNNRVKLSYNAYDEVIEARDKHHHVLFEYTSLGSLKSRTENGTKVTFDYNKEEQLTDIYNEKGEVYSFMRNQRGDIVEETGFDDLSRYYHRDRAGKVIQVDRPNGRYTKYEYDAWGRIIRAEHYDDTWEIFSYDKAGQLVEARNQEGVVLLKRDALGRVIKEVQGAAYKGFEQEVKSTYDRAGNRIGLTSSLGADIKFKYNTLGHVTGIEAQQGESESWQAGIQRNMLGLEVERQMTGGVTSRWEYDAAGRPIDQKVNSGGRTTRHRSYQWNVNDRLHTMINNLTGGKTNYHHDTFGNLAWAQYEDNSYDYKLPDEVGNLYKRKERTDRKYGKGSRLLQDEKWQYSYDEEGNMTSKAGSEGTWTYEWQGNGMMKKAISPARVETEFSYDALGRRTAKVHQGKVTRFIWDGNVPLHEWEYDIEDKPEPVIDDIGLLHYDKPEPVGKENLTTWVFENGSFAPSAKLLGEKRYSVVCDYLGTPVEAYDDKGEKVWECELDIYGKVRKCEGSQDFVPFRYQGQYEDHETGLYYNRFRYYDPVSGTYISQDPIRLAGGDGLYSYVHDCNNWIDPFGLNDLQVLANQAHSVLDPETAKRTTTAIGKDANGKLYLSSSKPYVPTSQKEWARANNVEVVQSKKPNVHAEEALVKSNKGITHIEPNRPICIDCEELMDNKKIKYEAPTSGKKSRSRMPGGKYCS